MSYQAVLNNLTPVMENDPQRMLEQLQNGNVYAALCIDENGTVNVSYLFAVKDGILCTYTLVGTNEAKLRLNLAYAAIASCETVYMMVAHYTRNTQRALFSCAKSAISDAAHFACCPDGDYRPIDSRAWEILKQQFVREPKLLLVLEPGQNPG